MFQYVVFSICFEFVSSLRLKDVEEGGCRGTPFKPVPDNGFDFLNTVPTFRYSVAGSRYDLYHYANRHPRFAEMHENELRDNMCLSHNGADASGRGAVFGFGGRVLANYTFAPIKGESAVFNFSVHPHTRGSSLAKSIHTITLTDYKTFVFFANCYNINSTEQKTWEVLSPTPNLSAAAKRAIENHAASLGFNRKNFVFLNFNTCGTGAGKYDRGSSGRLERNWRKNGQSGWSK